MSEFLATLVAIAHGIATLFVGLVPFVGSLDLVLINIAFMFGIMAHWYLNSNVCALTLLEKFLRREPDDEKTFFGSVFGGIYSLHKDSPVYWIGIWFLVAVSFLRLLTLIKVRA